MYVIRRCDLCLLHGHGVWRPLDVSYVRITCAMHTEVNPPRRVLCRLLSARAPSSSTCISLVGALLGFPAPLQPGPSPPPPPLPPQPSLLHSWRPDPTAASRPRQLRVGQPVACPPPPFPSAIPARAPHAGHPAAAAARLSVPPARAARAPTVVVAQRMGTVPPRAAATPRGAGDERDGRAGRAAGQTAGAGGGRAHRRSPATRCGGRRAGRW